jgi:hypothetical protein
VLILDLVQVLSVVIGDVNVVVLELVVPAFDAEGKA